MKAQTGVTALTVSMLPWLGWVMAGFVAGGLALALTRAFFFVRVTARRQPRRARPTE